jgi:hypothetical protein
MSIVTPDEVAAHWVPKERWCDYCSEVVPADAIAIIWIEQHNLLFHPACARRLGTHLICDSREAELASGRQPWTRRAGRVLRAALAAEEVRA